MNQQTDNSDYDVVIIGGGIVGLSFANELAGSDFTVAVIERNASKPVTETPDSRVSAINPFALTRYVRSGVLQSSLSTRICAYEKMFVWDFSGAGQVEFNSAETGYAELGAIVENRVMQQMLLENVSRAENINYYCPEEISSIHYTCDDKQTATEPVTEPATETVIELSSGQSITTKLLVGADGVSSRVRKIASIPQSNHSYQQHGLVCNVSTSESHQNTAWQCFLTTGPLAFLPLYNGQSSIVWSLDDTEALRIQSLDETAFRAALAEASEYRLGDIVDCSERLSFPLSHGHAENYVKPGLALIGDAAHHIHPLAGQGANLGIADAAALSKIIMDARQLDRNWASLHTLKKYQRQRKGENRLMEMSMTGFKNLFGNDNPFLSEIRNAGLSLVDHLPVLKYRIIKQALGD